LDICCGTGTITLAFAKHCKKVMGVEIVPDAIKDAEFNAEANGIKNCKFFTGNADDFIKSMVREALYEQEVGKPVDLIAVVDPPRAGLRKLKKKLPFSDSASIYFLSTDSFCFNFPV